MRHLLLTSTLFQQTPGPHQDILARGGFTITPMRGPLPQSILIEKIACHDAILCDEDDLSAAVLHKAKPRLKVISKVGATTAAIDSQACDQLGITLLTTAGINHNAVAEHTLCLMLALSRNLIHNHLDIRKGHWRRLPGNELRGRRLGILGLGRIGLAVAQLAHAFGMELHGHSRNWPAKQTANLNIQQHHSPVELAKAVDILSLHCPLTPQSHHLLNRDFIARMRPSTCIINTSRGALVDEQALCEALDNGHIGGYACDVLESEPPDKDDPLLRNPKTIITPHIGALTFQGIPRQLELAAEQLINFFENTTATIS